MKFLKYPDSRDLNDLSGPLLKQEVPIIIKLVEFKINQTGQLQMIAFIFERQKEVSFINDKKMMKCFSSDTNPLGFNASFNQYVFTKWYNVV